MFLNLFDTLLWVNDLSCLNVEFLGVRTSNSRKAANSLDTVGVLIGIHWIQIRVAAVSTFVEGTRPQDALVLRGTQLLLAVVLTSAAGTGNDEVSLLWLVGVVEVVRLRIKVTPHFFVLRLVEHTQEEALQVVLSHHCGRHLHKGSLGVCAHFECLIRKVVGQLVNEFVSLFEEEDVVTK